MFDGGSFLLGVLIGLCIAMCWILAVGINAGISEKKRRSEFANGNLENSRKKDGQGPISKASPQEAPDYETA